MKGYNIVWLTVGAISVSVCFHSARAGSWDAWDSLFLGIAYAVAYIGDLDK